MPTLGQQPHLKALCKLVSMKKQQLAGFYPFFMPLLYKNTDSSDRSHDSLSFSKINLFLMNPVTAFPSGHI